MNKLKKMARKEAEKMAEQQLGIDINGDGNVAGRPASHHGKKHGGRHDDDNDGKPSPEELAQIAEPPLVPPPEDVPPPPIPGQQITPEASAAEPPVSVARTEDGQPTEQCVPGSVPPSGVKKALLIGINYRGSSAELGGCLNDVETMKGLLQSQGYNDMMIMTDDTEQKPTKENIIAGFRWLVGGVRPGDMLFFHYSGHGGQEYDKDATEDDGYDETMVPLDYQRAGQIVDDVIHDALVAPLPSGVRLTSVMDCCHSGTGMDLPYKLGIHSGEWTVDDDPAHSRGDVQLFSGCQDDQTSADGDVMLFKRGGAMTNSFVRAFQGLNSPTYPDLLARIHSELAQRGFKQKPQLSSSQPFHTGDCVFSIQDGITPNTNTTFGRQGGRRKKNKKHGRKPDLTSTGLELGIAVGGKLLNALF